MHIGYMVRAPIFYRTISTCWMSWSTRCHHHMMPWLFVPQDGEWHPLHLFIVWLGLSCLIKVGVTFVYCTTLGLSCPSKVAATFVYCMTLGLSCPSKAGATFVYCMTLGLSCPGKVGATFVYCMTLRLSCASKVRARNLVKLKKKK